MLGQRIKMARLAAGLSQAAVAQRLDVSKMTISNWERDKKPLGSERLLQLATTLGVNVEYFLRPSDFELREVEYRKHASLPARDRKRIEGQVHDQVERFLELRSFFPESPLPEFEIPPLPARVESGDELEIIATSVRSAWNLGTNAIADMTQTLEERGILVLMAEPPAGRFDGMMFRADGTPVIVVAHGNSTPGDRQRFTLAHELGHLLLEGRFGGEFLDDSAKESACHRFAAAFLAPAESVRRALGASRKSLEPRELYQLKHEFGMSMGAAKHRARDLGIISAETYQRLVILFSKRRWRTTEPGAQVEPESPTLFVALVARALGENIIGESKAAELLRMPIDDLRRWRSISNDAA